MGYTNVWMDAAIGDNDTRCDNKAEAEKAGMTENIGLMTLIAPYGIIASGLGLVIIYFQEWRAKRQTAAALKL